MLLRCLLISSFFFFVLVTQSPFERYQISTVRLRSESENFYHGTTAPIGPGPHRGFAITLRHTTFGRAPLDEWSARHRDLYLSTDTAFTTDRLRCLLRVPNPRSPQASGRRPTPYIARPLGSTFIYLCYVYIFIWAMIAQRVQRLSKGWTVRGSNPGWGWDFPHPSGPALGLTQLPVQWVPGLSRG